MNHLLMIPALLNLGTGEIIIIVFVILLLFGGKKIPELMKGVGKGVRSFHEGMSNIEDEIKNPRSTTDSKSKDSDEPAKKD